MYTYRLIYSDDGIGVAQTIEFDANDPGAALNIADRHEPNRSAELWCDRERLCTIRRSENGFWAID
ncbi:hypothetical protein H0274_07840 [Altererythrobacter sp. CC-YST694]|uniref:hypothetical protein n=1 Tax=Altererythrobacter sp. CC-YST694 TaxID=2755038 RepID=UPI001D00EC25|nr:hypothetical protein [Altererythrobacter sp. CC-YST694]MCB5425164.1 hypothetical protein [Altererythrobacter sp. CC-YST694]